MSSWRQIFWRENLLLLAGRRLLAGWGFDGIQRMLMARARASCDAHTRIHTACLARRTENVVRWLDTPKSALTRHVI
jgi:hypothetical protein